MGFPGGSAGKESAYNGGDLGSIPELGRSPGEGKGCPFQYYGLENSLDCVVHGVAKSWTQLGNFHFLLSKNEIWLQIQWGFPVALVVKNLPMQEADVRDAGLVPGLSLGKSTSTLSSPLAWRIPRTEEPGGLQSIGSQRVRHD